ncbi:unnamed protein product [Sphagnum troendelagicum]
MGGGNPGFPFATTASRGASGSDFFTAKDVVGSRSGECQEGDGNGRESGNGREMVVSLSFTRRTNLRACGRLVL